MELALTEVGIQVESLVVTIDGRLRVWVNLKPDPPQVLIRRILNDSLCTVAAEAFSLFNGRVSVPDWVTVRIELGFRLVSEKSLFEFACLRLKGETLCVIVHRVLPVYHDSFIEVLPCLVKKLESEVHVATINEDIWQ